MVLCGVGTDVANSPSTRAAGKNCTNILGASESYPVIDPIMSDNRPTAPSELAPGGPIWSSLGLSGFVVTDGGAAYCLRM